MPRETARESTPTQYQTRIKRACLHVRACQLVAVARFVRRATGGASWLATLLLRHFLEFQSAQRDEYARLVGGWAPDQRARMTILQPEMPRNQKPIDGSIRRLVGHLVPLLGR